MEAHNIRTQALAGGPSPYFQSSGAGGPGAMYYLVGGAGGDGQGGMSSSAAAAAVGPTMGSFPPTANVYAHEQQYAPIVQPGGYPRQLDRQNEDEFADDDQDYKHSNYSDLQPDMPSLR
eukprot:GHVT01009611.1.p2 GENE.GHVT01009611.1~~GHVT01009611.1.p2  ORF type:complete len:119 (+),score=23.92 GHVT01009611.1:989-1345(+)